MLELDKVAGWKLTIMRSPKLESFLITSNGNITCFSIHVCVSSVNLGDIGKFVLLRQY